MADEGDIYKAFAENIWQNDPYNAPDRIRWHSSGYHISENSLTLEDALEDAMEALDVNPVSCGIDVDIGVWQERYLSDPGMLSAMASTIYDNLKVYGNYSFTDDVEWYKEAKRFLSGYL
ncbi:MAG: hypothetical protein ACLFNK_02425 [Candidatus Woesearchaeota archaeon]